MTLIIPTILNGGRLWIALAAMSFMQSDSASHLDADEIAKQDNLAGDVWTIDNLVVAVIDSADVPSTIAGTIRELSVHEGDSVLKGQALAQLDEAEAKSVYMQAVAEAKIADELAASSVAENLAAQDLALAKQAIDRQAMSIQIAEKKATSDIRVRAAEKAALVAKNEFERASVARERFSDSVSQSEIDGLRLTHQRAILESQQAELERQLDSLNAQIERQTSLELTTNLRAAELEVSKARFDQSILRLRANSTRHQVEQAKLVVLKHRITSPLDGVIAEVFSQPGEWVKPGDAILRIVRLNRLRGEGFLSSEQAAGLRLRRHDRVEAESVLLDWVSTTGEIKTKPAKIQFISPEVDAINGQVRFWVEFENDDLLLLPGMKIRAHIKILAEKGSDDGQAKP